MQTNNMLIAKKIGILVVLVMFTSCKKNRVFSPDNSNGVLTLSTSDSTLVLNQANAYNTAITFNWTAGSNHQTSSSISYILEIDKKGNNFQTAIKKELGPQVYNLSYTEGILNDSLLNRWKFSPGTVGQLEAKVIGVIGDTSVAPDTSQIISITVTPYRPVSNTLYIIGDATPTGWDNSKSLALTPDQTTPGLFHFQGTLNSGQFKFITALGSFLPSYNEGADNFHLILRTLDGQPDNKFTINTTAVYLISVNIIADTINVQQLAQSPYSALWVVGDATPNGWNIDNPNPMFPDPSNSFVFKFNAVLNAGEFKIPTATGNWGCAFYRPYSNHPPLSDTSVQLVPNGSSPANTNDYKWSIPAAGPYKIKLDLSVPSISIQAFTPYTRLWMVGDATPNGWNINSPTPLTADPANPYIFTYTGPLSAGEFKIPTATGNWGTDYFRPYANHPGMTDTTAQFVPHGFAPADVTDYKWSIPTAGNYKITFDQLRETIFIQKQ